MKIYTIPEVSDIMAYYRETPGYMHPTMQPYAVVFEGALTGEECDRIIETQEKLRPYKFEHCNALTRECERPITEDLMPISQILEVANESCFEYDIDWESTTAWLQTYDGTDSSYQKHMDGAIGQTRKLTAVAFLTSVSDYTGGHLILDIPPNQWFPNDHRGSVVVFPGWVSHEVTPLKLGIRQTINMGVWGPPFK